MGSRYGSGPASAVAWFCAAVVAGTALVGCDGTDDGGSGDAAPTTTSYDGDYSGWAESAELGQACDDAVSVIGYADDLLLRLGQEPYQRFDRAVRSRLSNVEGTLLNAGDWPTDGLAAQSQRVQALAHYASLHADGAARVRALTLYREQATELVVECRDAAG